MLSIVLLIYTVPTVSPTMTMCSTGYSYFGPSNRCYSYVASGVNWDIAKTNCQSAGAWLSTIESEAVWSFVWGLTPGNANTWIGLNDIATETTFVWEHGDTHTYRNWGPNEPGGGTGENCVVLYSDYGGKFDDAGCSYNFAYICEMYPLTSRKSYV